MMAGDEENTLKNGFKQANALFVGIGDTFEG